MKSKPKINKQKKFKATHKPLLESGKTDNRKNLTHGKKKESARLGRIVGTRKVGDRDNLLQ